MNTISEFWSELACALRFPWLCPLSGSRARSRSATCRLSLSPIPRRGAPLLPQNRARLPKSMRRRPRPCRRHTSIEYNWSRNFEYRSIARFDENWPMTCENVNLYPTEHYPFLDASLGNIQAGPSASPSVKEPTNWKDVEFQKSITWKLFVEIFIS